MTRTHPVPPNVLTMAGSDSGGGAGIQADLKTFAALGCHGVSALTALTAQHTRGVTAIHVPPADFLAAQIDAVFADFVVAAVKLGMLADAATVARVAERLEAHRPPAIVLDPVMVASSGAQLLTPDAIAVLRSRLLPQASVLTPNLPEAELLLETRIVDTHDALAAGRALCRLGARAVLLKGGHGEGDPVQDFLFVDGEVHRFEHPRLPLQGHGTGCTLASAIAALLARGQDLRSACRNACDFLHGALLRGYRPGRGEVVVLDPLWQRPLASES